MKSISLCEPFFYDSNTPVRDKFSMQTVLTALTFPHIEAVLLAYSQKAMCSRGRTQVYDKVMYGVCCECTRFTLFFRSSLMH